jgi:AcrR family transcriptional regulator
MEQRAYDMRERKRTRTRLMIQAEAMRLFADKGYENTTVEDIAYAAAISPRTFFRYFPTKEDVVLWDEYDPIALEFFEARPTDEPLLETLRAFIHEALGGIYRRDPDELLLRVRLLTSVAELRGRMRDQERTASRLMGEFLARTRGLPPDDLDVHVLSAAYGAAVMVALERWVEADGEPDPVALADQALDVLAPKAPQRKRSRK